MRTVVDVRSSQPNLDATKRRAQASQSATPGGPGAGSDQPPAPVVITEKQSKCRCSPELRCTSLLIIFQQPYELPAEFDGKMQPGGVRCSMVDLVDWQRVGRARPPASCAYICRRDVSPVPACQLYKI